MRHGQTLFRSAMWLQRGFATRRPQHAVLPHSLQCSLNTAASGTLLCRLPSFRAHNQTWNIAPRPLGPALTPPPRQRIEHAGLHVPPRALRKLLLVLPPDATLLIYMYFLLLLYISAAALSVILVSRPWPLEPGAPPPPASTRRGLLRGLEPAAAVPADGRTHGLEAAIWMPAVFVLRTLDALAPAAAEPGGSAGDAYGMLLIGVFLVSLGLPLVLLVWVTASNPASSTILHPAKFMRPTVSNLLVLSATVAEAVQLSASTFQVSSHTRPRAHNASSCVQLRVGACL